MIDTDNALKILGATEKGANQSKIAKIALESAKEGTDFSESSSVDDDWLARYMDFAKFISNEDKQIIWGKILAGEFQSPGSTPPQLARILSEITEHHANIFNNICNLSTILSAKTSDGIVFSRHCQYTLIR